MARKANKRTGSKTSKSARTHDSAGSYFYSDMLGIAGTVLRGRQEAGAEKILTLATAARNFAGELPEIPHIQTYVDSAADQMDALAEYVAENDLEQMVTDAGDMARRYPFATTAFALAAGFAFTRLMTSSFGKGRASQSTQKRTTRPSSGPVNAKKSASNRKSRGNGAYSPANAA